MKRVEVEVEVEEEEIPDKQNKHTSHLRRQRNNTFTFILDLFPIYIFFSEHISSNGSCKASQSIQVS